MDDDGVGAPCHYGLDYDGAGDAYDDPGRGTSQRLLQAKA